MVSLGIQTQNFREKNLPQTYKVSKISESGATKKSDTVWLDAVCEWTLVDKTLETQADTKNAHKLTYYLNSLQDLKRLNCQKQQQSTATHIHTTFRHCHFVFSKLLGTSSFFFLMFWWVHLRPQYCIIRWAILSGVWAYLKTRENLDQPVARIGQSDPLAFAGEKFPANRVTWTRPWIRAKI